MSYFFSIATAGGGGGGSDITSNLLVHYKFDETTGLVADDSSPNGNDGTVADTTTWEAGHINNALLFNGSSQQVYLADNAAFHAATALTVAAWIHQAELSINRGIVGKWDYATDGAFAFQTNGTDPAELNVHLATALDDDGTGCYVATTNAVLVAATWTHVAFVFDGAATGNTNRLKVFVRGTQVAQTQVSGNVPAALTSATASLRVGMFGVGLTRYFIGHIDDFRAYTRALADADIAALAAL